MHSILASRLRHFLPGQSEHGMLAWQAQMRTAAGAGVQPIQSAARSTALLAVPDLGGGLVRPVQQDGQIFCSDGGQQQRLGPLHAEGEKCACLFEVWGRRYRARLE